MEIKNLKPIPNYIAQRIRKIDEQSNYYYGSTRFYAYLSKIDGELVKITVACKNYKNQWFCKQVAVHGIHSENCFVKDMEYSLMGYCVGWFDLGLSDKLKHFEDCKWCPAKDKYYDPTAPIVNRKYALKFEEYKYSAVDKCNLDVFKYLKVYEKYPQAEYLVKVGLQHLATNTKILKKVKEDKNFRKWLIRYAKILRNNYGKFPYFSAKEILNGYKENLPLLEEKKLERQIKFLKLEYHYRSIIGETIPDKKLKAFIDYREKNNIDLRSYADYLEACIALGLDMTLPKNLYPNDFKRWHDIRIEQYNAEKAKQDAEERKELYEKFALIAEKYLPLQRSKENTFIVVIAKSPQDLIREGRTLHHCVGRMTYDKRFADEESLIFFLRNANEPDTPFVTIEYSIEQKRILQCYGENNHKPNDVVMNYLNKTWLPYANRKINKIAA